MDSSSSSLIKATPRLWLNQIGIFDIVPNKGNGDCLFRSISQALKTVPVLSSSKCKPSTTAWNHSQLRKDVVRHIVTVKWSQFRSRIKSHWKPKLNPRDKLTKRRHLGIKKEYAHRMTQRSEAGTFYELLGAGDLYGFHVDYLTRVEGPSRADESDEDPQSYVFIGCRTNGCNVARDRPRFIFFHSRYWDGDGHWELLRPLYMLETWKILPLNRKLCGKVYYSKESSRPFDSSTMQQRLSDEYTEIESEVRKLDERCLLDDPEWPADTQDDFKGCAAEDFQPNLIQRKMLFPWKKCFKFFIPRCISFKIRSKKNSSKVTPK